MPPRLEALVTEFSKRDRPDIIQNGKVPLSDFGGSVTLKLLDRNGVKAEARLCFFMHTDSRYLWKLLQTTMVLKIQDEIGLHGKDAALRRLNTMSLKARLGLLN